MSLLYEAEDASGRRRDGDVRSLIRTPNEEEEGEKTGLDTEREEKRET